MFLEAYSPRASASSPFFMAVSDLIPIFLRAMRPFISSLAEMICFLDHRKAIPRVGDLPFTLPNQIHAAVSRQILSCGFAVHEKAACCWVKTGKVRRLGMKWGHIAISLILVLGLLRGIASAVDATGIVIGSRTTQLFTDGPVPPLP